MYIERWVIDLFVTSMELLWYVWHWLLTDHVANMNNKDIGHQLHNTCIRKDKDVPYDYPITSKIMVEHVWDAFTLLALLEDCEHQATLLIVPHLGNQSVHFRAAIQARNHQVQANGCCMMTFSTTNARSVHAFTMMRMVPMGFLVSCSRINVDVVISDITNICCCH